MNINNIPMINPSQPSDSLDETDGINIESINSIKIDVETKQTLDKVSGLLQGIMSDKLSEDVIRKMPSNEYLHLLSLLDDIIGGSIDKHV